MSVVLYKDGESKAFDPFGFKDQLNKGWFFSKEESLNGMRTREGEGEGQGEGQAGETEQAEEIRKRTTFICNGCKKRVNRFKDTIVYDDSENKFCSEECKG